jgi:DNA-binding CsgD family transcriptional regulator
MSPDPHAYLERRRYELHCALDWGSLWPAVVGVLDAAMPYHSCSLLFGIENFRATETRHHIVAGDYFNFKSASLVAVSGPFLQTHPHIKLYTYSDVRRTDPAAAQRRLQKEVSLSAWDQFVHLVFWDEDRPDALFSVRRTAAQGDFSPTEKEFLAGLHSDLDAALHRVRQLQRERHRQAVVRHFVSNLPLPVLFLDERRRLSFATDEAYERCAVWNLGADRAGQLNARQCFRVPADIARVCAQFLNDPTTDATTKNEIRVVHATIPELSATVNMSTPRRRCACHTFVVTFSTQRMGEHAPTAALGALSQLTPSERRVALLVAGGRRNQDVACTLGKSLRTVEFQLNVIYRKLGIRSRTQLTGILASAECIKVTEAWLSSHRV